MKENKILDLNSIGKIYESVELLKLLKATRYVYNGRIHGNLIGISLENKDSSAHTMSATRLVLKLGKNITSIGVEQLLEISKQVGWWFVFNRCKHTKVEIEFFISI